MKEGKSSLLKLPIFLLDSAIAADKGVVHANVLNTKISPQSTSPWRKLCNVGKDGKEK